MGLSHGRIHELKEAIISYDVERLKTLLQDDGGLKLNDTSRGSTPLYLAVQEGHEDLIDMLLQHGSNVDAGTPTETPLHLAAMKANSAIGRRLLANGADVKAKDAHQHTPLCNAVHCDDIEMVMELLKAGSDANQPYGEAGELCVLNSRVLIQAVKCGKLEVISALLKYGADVNIGDASGHRRHPLHHAMIRGGDIPLLLLSRAHIDINCVDRDNMTPLHIACKIGNEALVKQLINAGCDLNPITQMKSVRTGCFTPLHLAVLEDYPTIIWLLCTATTRSSSIIHRSRINFNATDICQRTPLSHACERGLTEVTSILLQKGCDVNMVDYAGDPPLIYACKRGHFSIVTKLIGISSCDINMPGVATRTALHHASERGYVEICRILLNGGATLLCVDRYGITPLKYAISAGNVVVVGLLLKAGHLLPEQMVEVPQILQMVNVTSISRSIILRLLVLAGWRPVLRGFQKFIQIVQHVNADTAMIKWLEDQLYNPMRLQECCRLAVKKRIIFSTKGILTTDAFETLPIPKKLKSYLLFSDITDCNGNYSLFT